MVLYQDKFGRNSKNNMTNLVAEIVVTLTLATNWTGVNFNNHEVGYIVTNHTATITYEGEKKDFALKSVASNIAVWRPANNWLVITNSAIYFKNWTNDLR